MPDLDVDLGTLSEAQQESLSSYLAVTDQDVGAAVALLQRSDWNVQIAITKFYDGEAGNDARLLDNTLPDQPIISPPRRQALLNGDDFWNDFPQDTVYEIAPRITHTVQRQSPYELPLVLRILLAPFNILTRAVGLASSAVGYTLSFLPALFPALFRHCQPASEPKVEVPPRKAAERLLHRLESEHGVSTSVFYADGYAQAYDEAKKENKFLLVILTSFEHASNGQFISEILASSRFSTFLDSEKANLATWIGCVQDGEAYRVSIGLRCSQMPFVTLIAPTSRKGTPQMEIIVRHEDNQNLDTLLSKLQKAIDEHKADLLRLRSEQQSQQAARALRQEQENAYEKSLAADRAKLSQRREAEANAKRLEEAAQQKTHVRNRFAESQARWRRWRAQQFLSEPSLESDRCRVNFRMASGDRVIRNFSSDAPVEELYAFVECYPLLKESTPSQLAPPEGYKHDYQFTLVSPLPRTEYPLTSSEPVGALIGRSATLIVESHDSDDSDRY